METTELTILDQVIEFLTSGTGATLVSVFGGLLIAKIDPTNKVVGILRKVVTILDNLLRLLETKKK